MQEQLREIEGTLARSSERKSTILYKLAKRRAEAERLSRLGVKQLPRSPHATDNIAVVRHVLFTVKRDLGALVARLRDPARLSIERDGEAAVRLCNDEANALLARRLQWEARLSLLTGRRGDGGTRDSRQRARGKTYFGCARELPEARNDAVHTAGDGDGPRLSSDDDDKDEKDESGSDDESDARSDVAGERERQGGGDAVNDGSARHGSHAGGAYHRALCLLAGHDAAEEAALLRAEGECERQQRSEAHALARPTASVSDAGDCATEYIVTYMRDGILQLPSEETYKQQLLAQRRSALQRRIADLRRTM